MNGIKYYYINLDSRVDRNQHIVDQFKKFRISDYERIPAIYDDYGYIGCAKSHILALQNFIVSGYDKCVILEDDFEFTIPPRKYYALLDSVEQECVDWNVILLSGNIIRSEPYNDFLQVCVEAQTTSGYMLNKRFASNLLVNYQEGLGFLSIRSIRNQNIHTIDQYWKKLQGEHNKWFLFTPKCGRQMMGFSDIEKKKTFYRC